ncbi:MAG TPA: glycosyl transferase family 1, partial [Roseovarius nubinhibens]|nr:glycosyl transferase family 1 [Roseovarius nubinhibens]
SRDALLALRAEVRKCESRVEKLQEMSEKLATKLADPALYDEDRVDEAAVWQRKYSEVCDGLERAEALWMRALEKLEAAEA